MRATRISTTASVARQSSRLAGSIGSTWEFPGGVWGLTVGFCASLGGKREVFDRFEPAVKTLAPEGGYLYCGPAGAGHYVKMVHNGIEYGVMQAYGEGFDILHASDFDVDLASVARMWQNGSVIRSWLLELAGDAFEKEGNDLSEIKGWVNDSGEGRWTVFDVIDHDVPAPIITLSLIQRFPAGASRTATATSARRAAQRVRWARHQGGRRRAFLAR